MLASGETLPLRSRRSRPATQFELFIEAANPVFTYALGVAALEAGLDVTSGAEVISAEPAPIVLAALVGVIRSVTRK